MNNKKQKISLSIKIAILGFSLVIISIIGFIFLKSWEKLLESIMQAGILIVTIYVGIIIFLKEQCTTKVRK